MTYATEYLVSLAVGGLMVAFASIERFSEPTYKPERGNRELYKKFKPQYFTSDAKYYTALSLYCSCMVGLYLLIAYFPSLIGEFEKLSGNQDARTASALSPFVAASIVMGLQGIIFINKLESSFRRLFHRWAKIPQGVGKTLNQLRACEFSFSQYKDRDVLDEPEFDLVEAADFDSDERMRRRWARVCCLVYCLRSQRSQSAISFNLDAAFLDEYFEEIDEIKRVFRSLAAAIESYRKHARPSDEGNARDEQVSSPQQLRQRIQEEMDDLLDRLYSFIACAVRSRATTESEVIAALKDIGFIFPHDGLTQIDTTRMFATFLAVAVVAAAGPLTIDVVFSDECRAYEANAIQGVVAAAGDPCNGLYRQIKQYYPYIPTRHIDALMWALGAAAVHGLAALVALQYRHARVRARRWFGSERNRQRPYEKYFIAALFGGCAGYVATSVLVLLEPGVKALIDPGLDWGLELRKGLVPTSTMILLGATTAFFCLYYVDSHYPDDDKQSKWIYPLVQGVVVGLVGFLTTDAYVEIWHAVAERPRDAYFLSAEVHSDFYCIVFAVTASIGAFMGWIFPLRQQRHQSEHYLGAWTYKDEGNHPCMLIVFEDRTITKNRQTGADGWSELSSGRWKVIDGGAALVEWNDEQANARMALSHLDLTYEELAGDNGVSDSTMKHRARKVI